MRTWGRKTKSEKWCDTEGGGGQRGAREGRKAEGINKKRRIEEMMIGDEGVALGHEEVAGLLSFVNKT